MCNVIINHLSIDDSNDDDDYDDVGDSDVRDWLSMALVKMCATGDTPDTGHTKPSSTTTM